MTSWQGAKILYQHEMRRAWIGLLLTILFFTYVNIVMMPLFKEILIEKASEDNMWWFGDFFYMTILPMMGFLMNRSYIKYWNKDPFTRKLAYWRTMPIGLSSIIIARMLQLVTVLLCVGVFFYPILYLIQGQLRELLSPLQYMIFVLIWVGYSLTVSSTYVIFEQLLSGKKYLIVCISYVIGYSAVSLANWYFHLKIVFHTIKAAQQQEIIWPVCSILIGIIVMIIAGFWIRSRLALRNLLS